MDASSQPEECSCRRRGHRAERRNRAADTFYVTDLTGGKLQPGDRMNRIEARLMEAASDATQDRLENA